MIDSLALSSRSTLDVWILWFIQYSSSVRIERISSMMGSFDVEMDARKVNFALDLRSDNDGIYIYIIHIWVVESGGGETS